MLELKRGEPVRYKPVRNKRNTRPATVFEPLIRNGEVVGARLVDQGQFVSASLEVIREVM